MYERPTDIDAAKTRLVHTTISLQPARARHAAYIYSLRVDPSLNKHLSSAPASIDAQRAWLDRYAERERTGAEYYFVIERLDGTACGTVRLYDFQQNSFCWGSWILDANKTKYASIESALLVYRMGFEVLGFEQSHFDVRKENTRVIDFHLRMGAQETKSTDIDRMFIITRAAVAKATPELETKLRLASP